MKPPDVLYWERGWMGTRLPSLLPQVFDCFHYANTGSNGRPERYMYCLCAMRSQGVVSDEEL